MTENTMVTAVVFDLDGVLVDSEPVWEQVRRGLVAERGGHWARDAQRRIMGMSTPEWASYLSEDLGVGLPPDEVARLVIDRMVARCQEQVPFMDGAVAIPQPRYPPDPDALAEARLVLPNLAELTTDAVATLAVGPAG